MHVLNIYIELYRIWLITNKRDDLWKVWWNFRTCKYATSAVPEIVFYAHHEKDNVGGSYQNCEERDPGYVKLLKSLHKILQIKLHKFH